MINIIYNSKTKETTIVDVADIDIQIDESEPKPTLEEVVEDLVVTLQDKGVLP